ncbi:MAG: TolC family protein, partial [Syntrophomonas sp.]
DLDKAFVAFNQVIGLNSDDRPLLTDTVEYKPLEIKSLDYEVASVLENSPTVWLAEQNVNMQEYLKDMAFYTGSYRPYEIRQKEMEQVQLDVASTKKATEQATRSSYYAIKSLEDSYPGALQNVKVAEENLRITKTKFDIGMATVADVASMEKALADAQYTVFQMTVNHEYMKLAFHKPWAASGGAVSE